MQRKEKINTCCSVCGETATPQSFTLRHYQIFACPQCNLRFAPEAFDVPVDYDDVYASKRYYVEQVKPVSNVPKNLNRFVNKYRLFFETVSKESGVQLLDIGCGVGRFCHAAESQGWQVTGIEISTNAADIAKKFATFPIINATLTDLIKQQQQFDVATAFEVLEHLTDPVGFLRQARQVVKPGGQLYCSVPNWDCRLVQQATRYDWVPPIHLNFFTEQALQWAATAAGFQNIQTGVVWADVGPQELLPKAWWLFNRRVFGKRNRGVPLGLWLYARKPLELA